MLEKELYMDIEKFEKFLLNRQYFLKDMLLIIKDQPLHEGYQIQLDEINDIIHHFNVLVKGEISNGLGIDKKE